MRSSDLLRSMHRAHRRRARSRGVALLEVLVFVGALLAFWQALAVISSWWRTATEARFVVGETLISAAAGREVPDEHILADGTVVTFDSESERRPPNVAEELEALGLQAPGPLRPDELLPSSFVSGSSGVLILRGTLPEGVFGGDAVVLSTSLELSPRQGAPDHANDVTWKDAVEADLIERWRPFDFDEP